MMLQVHVKRYWCWFETTKTGHYEWKQLFGGEVVGSQYQDGHFVYQVVKGGGTGDDAYPPVLYVADIENATHFNNVLNRKLHYIQIIKFLIFKKAPIWGFFVT